MKRALGIEVGRSFVAVCEIVVDRDGAPRAQRLASRVLPATGGAGGEAAAPEELADAALALAVEAGVREREAVLALGRSLTWDKQVALPPLPEPERIRLLTLQPDRFFPIAERSVVCDLDTGGDGETRIAHAADAEQVERLVEALQARGFRVAAVLPSVAALRRAAVVGAPELARGNWLLLRAENGDLAALACRGGEVRLSRRVERFLERPEAAVREVSRTARHAFDPTAPLEQVRWVGWRELPEEVRRLAGSVIPAPVRDLPDPAVGSDGIAAFGAAVAALEDAPRPDLLPPTLRARRRQQARWVTAACAALALLGALSLLWALGERQERRLRELEAAVAAAGPAAEEAATARDSLVAVESRLDALRRRMAERSRWIAAAPALADALPDGAWLSTLTIENGGTVTLTGYARTASALIPTLERTQALAGVELAAPATRAEIGGRELEAFNIRAVLEASPADSARTSPDTTGAAGAVGSAR